MDDSIIYTYLSGKATEEEKARLRDWLNQSPKNRTYFFDLKAIRNAQRVTNKINAEGIEDSLARMNKRIDSIPHSSKRAILNIRLRRASIAALLFICVSLFCLYITHPRDVANPGNNLVTYTNEATGHSVKMIHLSDGTVVWLGSRTVLTAPSVFTGGKRVVCLSGEAFFDVTKDPSHPFVIQTNLHEVQVLGTSFGINTDEEAGICKTILMSGSVRIQDPSGNNLAVLTPGQQALYSQKTGNLEIEEVDVNALTSWRFGLISLSNVAVKEILRCLEETYQVKIQMNTASLENRRYNFSFKHSKGVEAALKQLFYITGISASIQPQR
ncbi:FecR family protein [Parabacteroides sp. ZJ-118]|uniref:FecR family protein n=1 Tax=Parabacteroides sp. ZJ-118 TaxID=2709398 RepID=UPI0013E9DC94|nr:FecR family protein [Parabacteroides sp. ZJ-118]